MSTILVPDKLQPSVTVEIPLEKPLPDYDLEHLEQPTPRDVDSLLVSQGFRDLVDDARGVLTELVTKPPQLARHASFTDLDLTHVSDFEITQLSGAICPLEDGVYRPGLWIVLKDRKAPQKQGLKQEGVEHARVIIEELIRRLGI